MNLEITKELDYIVTFRMILSEFKGGKVFIRSLRDVYRPVPCPHASEMVKWQKYLIEKVHTLDTHHGFIHGSFYTRIN